MKKQIIILTALLIVNFQLLIVNSLSAQNIGINTSGNAPNASAALDIDINQKGLLVPRMSTANRNAIVSPAHSLLIYNTTTDCFEAWNQSTLTWVAFGCINCQLPGAFSATAAISSTQTSFSANWAVSVGATTYFLDIATDAAFTAFVAGYNNLNVGNVVTSNVTGLTCGTTYYYRVRANNSCGTSANSNAITVTTAICCTIPSISDTALKTYYKFDALSGNIINASLSSAKIANSDLVVAGATYGATGIINNSLLFNNNISNNAKASSSLISDWAFLNNNTANFTIVYWVKYVNFATIQDILATTNFNGGEVGLLIRTETTRQITVFCGGAVDLVVATTTGTIPNDSNWHFIAITIQNNIAVQVRIDGNAFQTIGVPVFTNTSNPETFLTIGYDSGTSYPLNGNIDEVSIWNRVLTNAEIDCLYNGGLGQGL